jgi:hypothetical protein
VLQDTRIQLTAYVFPGEGAGEVQTTASSVLSLDLDPLQVEWAEQEASESMAGKEQVASPSQVNEFDVRINSTRTRLRGRLDQRATNEHLN